MPETDLPHVMYFSIRTGERVERPGMENWTLGDAAQWHDEHRTMVNPKFMAREIEDAVRSRAVNGHRVMDVISFVSRYTAPRTSGSPDAEWAYAQPTVAREGEISLRACS